MVMLSRLEVVCGEGEGYRQRVEGCVRAFFCGDIGAEGWIFQAAGAVPHGKYAPRYRQ